jgi:ABC-2 type transport system permease protein
MRATARSLAATWWAGWRQARADRRAFTVQVTTMLVNDLTWVVYWLVFFDRVGPIQGWAVEQVLTLVAISSIVIGVTVGLFANSRHLGRVAVTGELEASLALPVPTLLHLLCRRIDPIYVIDVAFGTGLFLAVVRPGPVRLVLLVVVVGSSVVLTTGVLVLSGALSLLSGRQEPGDFGFHVMALFSFYPIDVFGSTLKLVLYLVVPAGFVASVPARILADPDPALVMAAVAAAAVFASVGWWVFHLAVRRYTSGAAWTVP